jgi:stearoyl-CoA desaturase (delta-9 desaturase)
VIANRYDVMAKYAKSDQAGLEGRAGAPEGEGAAGSAFPEDFAQAAAARAGQAGSAATAATGGTVPAQQGAGDHAHMRVELGVIWERSHFTRDQLLHKLQDWCNRAEPRGYSPCRNSRCACAATLEMALRGHFGSS